MEGELNSGFLVYSSYVMAVGYPSENNIFVFSLTAWSEICMQHNTFSFQTTYKDAAADNHGIYYEYLPAYTRLEKLYSPKLKAVYF